MPKVSLKRGTIQVAMVRRNMSQNMLAMRIGISSGYISQLMRGTRHASPDVRKKLLDIFTPLTFDDLFTIAEGDNGD
jgi:transcriptional regulator with XRE-family HTH domain